MRAIGNRNPACALGRDFVQPNDSGYQPVRNQPARYPRSGMGSGLSGMRNIVRRFYLRTEFGQSASELKTKTIEEPSFGISRACRTNTIEPRAKPIRRAPTSHQRRRAGSDPPAARPAAGAAGSRARRLITMLISTTALCRRLADRAETLVAAPTLSTPSMS